MFLPHFSTVQSDAAPPPSRWLVVLHGIYGRGGNWRRVARALITMRPAWGVLLVDLRMHGRSMDAPPPHTMAACASDVLSLIEAQAREGRQVSSIMGHSFGGKVALQVFSQRAALDSLWLIDSSPSERLGAMSDPANTVVSVLRMLQGLPEHFDQREVFVREVLQQGFSMPLAEWLAMNLELEGGHYRMTLDPNAMESLLTDYFSMDLWGGVEKSTRPIHVAIATTGSAISTMDRKRFQLSPKVCVHDVEGGHWLHVDALDTLAALVAATFVYSTPHS